MTFQTKKVKLFIFSFYKVEINVATVYDYSHQAYYDLKSFPLIGV